MSTSETPALPRLIAIVGQEGSGKDTYAEYLAELGYMHVSAGNVMRKHARDQGYTDPIPREILSRVGDKLKQEFGPSPITESSISNYEAHAGTYPLGLVISGLRRVGELEALKSHGGVVLWIDASIGQRFNNQRSRGRDDQQDLASFTEQSRKEYFGITEGSSVGVNLRAVEALADCRVKNDSTIDDLLLNANNTLAKHS